MLLGGHAAGSAAGPSIGTFSLGVPQAEEPAREIGRLLLGVLGVIGMAALLSMTC